MLTGQLAVVATPVRLIVDTDIGGGSCRDVDDVGAICMAIGGFTTVLDRRYRSRVRQAEIPVTGGAAVGPAD